jgi:hypothetical protein
MAFSWNKLVNIINNFTSPNQMVNWLFDQGAKKDPETAAILKRMYNAGEDASKVLIELSSQGKLTLEDLSKIKNMYNVLKRFGCKYTIPNSEWIKAEKAIRAGKSNKRGFTGF